MTLGSRIASARKLKGMSQELLADTAKISLRTIQRIEADSTVARPHTLKAIATALEIPVEEFTPAQPDTSLPVDHLKAINFSALSVVVLPVIHILIVLLTSRKGNQQITVETKRIISFQVLWTIVTIFFLLIVSVIQPAFTNSRAIGHFPPTIVIVYSTLLIVNLVLIVSAAIRLARGERDIFSFIPALF